MDFFATKKKVIGEIGNALSKLKKEDIEKLLKALLSARKVFVVGAGRSMLMMQAFAKRLNHLNVDVHVLGEVIEPPLTKKDLLIIASGSGETIFPLEIAKIVRRIGAKVVLITAQKESKIAKTANLVICIPAPTRFGSSKTKSSQPLGNLFEQSLLLFCDIIAMLIQKKKKLSNKELQKCHTNLE